jgi:serine/threonine protein kinase
MKTASEEPAGRPEPSESELTGASSESVDSFLREVARPPTLTPSDVDKAVRRPPPLDLAPGLVVATRFRLQRRLGEGGMGVVWAALHTMTRKPVALKILKRSGEDDERSVQRFLREARTACAVRHPSIVEVNDVLELEDGSPVMVMELLEGETLAQRLARERVLTLEELARVMVHVCSAVGCAHALGIVHRDLKPENIFLARSPAGQTVKVLDFGIAKLTASDGDAARSGALTGTGAILGTPYYMAPEQLFGEKDVDHRADIWALGIMFYEAITGERPTRGENVGQIYKVIVTDAIVPFGQRAKGLPTPFVDLVERMLARDRATRPADVGSVLSVLAAYTDEPFVMLSARPPRLGLAQTPPGEPATPVVGSEAEPEPDADAPHLRRSGVEVTLPSAVPRRSATGRVAVVSGAAALALGALLASRSRAPAPAVDPSAASAAASSPAHLQGAMLPVTSTDVLLPDSAPPASAGAPAPAPENAPTSPSRSAAARPSKHPARPLAPAPALTPSAAPPTASRPPAVTPPPVDPGSYQ